MLQCFARVRRAKKARVRLIKATYEKVMDLTTKRYFYYNTRTETSSWYKPHGLAAHDDVPIVSEEDFLSHRTSRKAGGECELSFACAARPFGIRARFSNLVMFSVNCGTMVCVCSHGNEGADSDYESGEVVPGRDRTAAAVQARGQHF